MKRIIISMLFVLCTFIGTSYSEIISNEFAPNEITRNQLYQAFTLMDSHWRNNYPIVIVIYKGDFVGYRGFVIDKLKMTTVTYERLIESRLLINANINAPVVVGSYLELVSTVSKTTGSIAFFNGNLYVYDDYKCPNKEDISNNALVYCFNIVTITD